MFDIPILFIIFKRKETALQSFQRIKKIKPSRLYIACDGPRKQVSGEDVQVEETRNAILQQIDWNCQTRTLFQSDNLGCALGVYTAIEWLFQNEPYGIILEDDCKMQESFFPYAKELLIRYENDYRIGMIDGANYLPKINIPYSYGFSRYKSTNGWATWRRAWKLMDLDMTWRGGDFEYSILQNMAYKSKEIAYWKYRQKAIDLNDVSAWDWQWYFTLAAYNMLSIYPKYSLITNIGFGEGATHTQKSYTPDYYIANKELNFPLQHPKYVVPYQPFEKAFHEINDTLYEKLKRLLPFPLKHKIKKVIKR